LVTQFQTAVITQSAAHMWLWPYQIHNSPIIHWLQYAIYSM